jgi:hypothetical protein
MVEHEPDSEKQSTISYPLKKCASLHKVTAKGFVSIHSLKKRCASLHKVTAKGFFT